MIRETEYYNPNTSKPDTVLYTDRELFSVNNSTTDLERNFCYINIPILFITKDIYKVLKANKLDLKLKSLTNIKIEDFLNMLSKHDIVMLESLNYLLERYVGKDLHIKLPSFLNNKIDMDTIKINLEKEGECIITDETLSEYIEIIHIDGTIVCIINPFLNIKNDVLLQIETLSRCLIKNIVNELFKQYDEKIVFSMWELTH